jgi:DNA-binding MarR family transcriptional regulator
MDDRIFLNDSLTYRLNVLADEAIEMGEPMFQRHVGCSIREMRVLRIVDDNPGINFAEIVRATRLERSLTSRLIQRLLGLGFIERRPTPGDARLYRLFATELGRRKRADAQRLTEEAEAIIASPLTPKQLRALDETLETLARWVRSEDFARQIAELDDRLEGAGGRQAGDGSA